MNFSSAETRETALQSLGRNVIFLTSFKVSKLQVAILARSSREMSETVRND